MAARLKVFRAHLGFYDTVVAAASQTAAIELWGAPKSEFTKGFAAVTDDPEAVSKQNNPDDRDADRERKKRAETRAAAKKEFDEKLSSIREQESKLAKARDAARAEFRWKTRQ